MSRSPVKRRHLLLLSSFAVMLTVALFAVQKRDGLLLLDWTAQAPVETAPVAILIEVGLKDDKPAHWSGRAVIKGAKVARREGYRFRAGDKLVGLDGWESDTRSTAKASTNPVANRLQRPATTGVVLHLTDVQSDATVTLEIKDKTKIVVAVKDLLAGQARLLLGEVAAIRRISTATPLASTRTEDDFPAAARGPDGTLWVAYISYTRQQVEDNKNRKLFPEIKEQPANFSAYNQPDYADQLWVKSYRDGKWSEPIAVTDARQDLVRCAVAVAGDGTVWVAYSAHRQETFDVFARPISGKYGKDKASPSPGPEQQLTKGPGSSLTPVMCTDQQGRPWLACQTWNNRGQAHIALFRLLDEKWQPGPALPPRQPGENCWSAALAAGPDGQVAVAYDVYRDGDYDVMLGILEGDRVIEHVVAGSPRFEARPSLAYDAQGRLWIAFEEGPPKWGKDFGALDVTHGAPLYSSRAVRVACWHGGKLLQPAAELPVPTFKTDEIPGDGINFTQYEYARRYSNPRLGLDGKGRVWLAYRQKIGTPFGTFPGSAWLTFARRLDGNHWTEPVEVNHSDGLLDHRPVLLPQPGDGLLMIHNTDGRYSAPATISNQIYISSLSLPGEPSEPKLVPREAGVKDAIQMAEERAAAQRIRDYRAGRDKQYQLLRGEFHRHTEFSFDGGSDGSLEDMFRYSIDAAEMDWIGNGDHDAGNREYSWWLIQKLTDAYHVKNIFTPMFCYERSVAYPHGHRNCLFAQRGVRVLPRLAEPDENKQVGKIHADDTKMLYRYLTQFGGICASHTSATNMGTDWRDNNKAVEPIVEIYQGDRNSYEIQGAPRAGYEAKSGKKPVNIGGWYPDGFIDLALGKKGYRLGFQASSDHHSTHVSFCIVLAERNDRESILKALRQRHCYGATDDIILDVRSGDHMMGDEFKTNAAPTLDLTVEGTRDLGTIAILKDSVVVATIKPGQRKYQGRWTDPNPTAGVHYYYVRVEQVGDPGQLAWGSPLWIDYTR